MGIKDFYLVIKMLIKLDCDDRFTALCTKMTKLYTKWVI